MKTVFSAEHYSLMAQFEKEFNHKRLDREKNTTLWESGQIYENGEVNELFKAYRHGCAFGKSVTLQELS